MNGQVGFDAMKMVHGLEDGARARLDAGRGTSPVPQMPRTG